MKKEKWEKVGLAMYFIIRKNENLMAYHQLDSVYLLNFLISFVWKVIFWSISRSKPAPKLLILLGKVNVSLSFVVFAFLKPVVILK
jgi:hypothetical protein